MPTATTNDTDHIVRSSPGKSRFQTAEQGRDFLKSIGRTAVRLNFREPDVFLSPLSSRVLGPGYWEREREWPTAQGLPMPLLLQINWTEVAACMTADERAATLLNLPESGLTQIYLHPSDRMAGCDLNDPCAQRGWRIVHWDNPSLNRYGKSSEAPGVFHPLFPATQSAAMSFSVMRSTGNFTDAVEGLNESDFDGHVFDDVLDQIPETDFSKSMSHIGGFPSFLEQDPRKARIGQGVDHRLLLQLGTDSPFRWKEGAQAHWLVRPADLQRLDFSAVSYTCEAD